MSREDVVFVAVIEGGRIKVDHGPFSLEGQDGLPPRPSELRALTREGDELLVITIDPERLHALVPAFPMERLGDIRLQLSGSSCSSVRVEREELVSVTAVGARIDRLSTEVFVPADEADRGLFVAVPIVEESCFDHPNSMLEPFGATEHLLDAESLVGGVRQGPESRAFYWVEALGNDRVVVAIGGAVLVLDRGAAWTDDPLRSFIKTSLPPASSTGDWGFVARGWALDPGRREADRFQVLFALNWVEPGDFVSRLAIGVVEWSEADGFGPPRLVYETESDNDHFRGLHVQADGRLVAFGDRGLLIVGSVNDPSSIELVPPAAIGRASLDAATDGLDASEPLVLLENRQRLFFGAASSTATFRLESPPELDSSSAEQLVRLVLPNGKVDLVYDAVVTELFVRHEDGARNMIAFTPPSDLETCVSLPDPCGHRKVVGRRPGLAAASWGTLLVAPGDCLEAFELDTETGCSRTLSLEDPRGDGPGEFLGTSFRDGTLTVGGADGRLVQARW